MNELPQMAISSNAPMDSNAKLFNGFIFAYLPLLCLMMAYMCEWTVSALTS